MNNLRTEQLFGIHLNNYLIFNINLSVFWLITLRTEQGLDSRKPVQTLGEGMGRQDYSQSTHSSPYREYYGHFSAKMRGSAKMRVSQDYSFFRIITTTTRALFSASTDSNRSRFRPTDAPSRGDYESGIVFW